MTWGNLRYDVAMTEQDTTPLAPTAGTSAPATADRSLFLKCFRLQLKELVEMVEPKLVPELDFTKAEFLDPTTTFHQLPIEHLAKYQLVARVRLKKGRHMFVNVIVAEQPTILFGLWFGAQVLHIRADEEALTLPVAIFLAGGPCGPTMCNWSDELGLTSVNYLAMGLSESLAEDWVNRPQALAAALSAWMSSAIWERDEVLRRAREAVGNAAVDDGRRRRLLDLVEQATEWTPQRPTEEPLGDDRSTGDRPSPL